MGHASSRLNGRAKLSFEYCPQDGAMPAPHLDVSWEGNAGGPPQIQG